MNNILTVIIESNRDLGIILLTLIVFGFITGFIFGYYARKFEKE